MRRTTPVIVLLAAIVVVVVLVLGSGSSSGYQVAAIFDTANGIVPGQQVKIAGAVVGTIERVELAPGPKARIVMGVERRFAPFRSDASCTILPEGLISENFVECKPGRSPTPLAESAAGTPTVSLAHTTVPFSLQDVLNVLSLPTDQRLQLLISELGIGTAGRGEDINALLRRANPALVSSQRMLAIVNAQRRRLGTAVGQTDQVLASLGARAQQVRQFVDRAAVVARTTSRHRTALGQTVARLPAMLAAVRPGLRSLDNAAINATPLLNELQSSAPGLTELTSTLPSFARAGIPALRTLASAAASGRPAVRDALPVVARLRAVTGPLATLAPQLSQLLMSSRSAGALDGLLWLAYTVASEGSLYDNTSHILDVIFSVAPTCIAGQQGGFDVAGCNHKYSGPGQGTVPINEPSCGAKSADWFAARCPPAVPGPIALARGRSGKQQAVGSALLESLVNGALSGKTVNPQRWQSLRPFVTN
jgi:virulence factor Mce-like protein